MRRTTLRGRKAVARLLLATAAFTVLAVVPSAFAWDVDMTADPALKRTHHWTIDKSVSTPAVTLGPGQTASVNYSVTVATTGSTDSDWSVSGLMEMTDDAKITVNSVVFKAIPEAPVNMPEILAAHSCMPMTFPVDLGIEGLACTYSAALPNADPRRAWMRATATHDNGESGFRNAFAPFDFSAPTLTEVDKCVNVTDSLAGSLGAVCAADAPKTFTYSTVVGPYGTCGEFVVPNVARITGDAGTELGSDNASVTVKVENCEKPAVFLVIDEDGIDNGDRWWENNATSFTPSTIKSWNAAQVNDDRPKLGQRTQLRYFGDNIGKTLWLWTGQVGDEGWFAPKAIPSSWAGAGPTTDGLRNFLGNPSKPYSHNVGTGLGTGSDPEKLLDKIPYVAPLRAEGLHMLIGRTVCAVVYDSDISINYGPLNGSLKGENLGVVAFEVHQVVYQAGFSSSTLPRVQVTIRDANQVCEGKQNLFNNAPEPKASSEPMDIRPNHAGDNSGYAVPTPIR